MYALFVLLSLLVVFGENIVFGNKRDFDKIDSIHQEETCSRAGGMCVIASDCPPGRLTQEGGLCPKQWSDGVECCYGRSVKDTRCKTLGICRPIAPPDTCNPRLVIPATDCPDNTRCCILV